MWGRVSGGNHQLSLDDFFWCYKPQHIVLSQGIYHFIARKNALRLVLDMPDSNKNWKGKYFFVKGTNWVCHSEEWDIMPHGFDNTWDIVKDLGFAPSTFAFTFSFIPQGLASMPLWDTMNSRNFLGVTPKAHLPGLSFML